MCPRSSDSAEEAATKTAQKRLGRISPACCGGVTDTILSGQRETDVSDSRVSSESSLRRSARTMTMHCKRVGKETLRQLGK